jgi:hypothetical protein
MFLYEEKKHESSRTVSKKITVGLIILGLVTVGLGAWTFFQIGPGGENCPLEIETVPTRLYRLPALFEFSEENVKIGECYTGWQIEAARFIGPFTTLGLLIQLVIAALTTQYDKLRLKRFSGHTIIVGFGEKGQVRALEAVSAGAQVVAVENVLGETSHAFAKQHKIALVVGDALATGDTRNFGPLSEARFRYAERFVVATGNDSRNLSIAQVIAQQIRGEPARNRKIDVSIRDPLIRRALDASPTNGLIDAFSIEDMAAHRLCETARFFILADLQGHRRIHIVMLGFDRLGASIAAQILRSSQLASLDTPLITILSANVADESDLLLSYPGIKEIADIKFIPANPRRVDINNPLPPGIEAGTPITAIVVLGTRSADTLPVALAVRHASRRARRSMAPIFFGVEHATSLTDFSRPIETEPRLSEVLHAFEISAHLCTRKYAEERDRVAEKIHEAYRAAFVQMQEAGQKPSTGNQALVPWHELSRTYRKANRRAADHIAAKLLSAGCVVPPGPPLAAEHFDLLADDGALERLAELEHRAWETDRKLDGWRYGPIRDDSRWFHDCLIPYADLPEATKELDRAQIRELNAARIPRVSDNAATREPLVRFDLWVGLIGTRSLSRMEADWARGAILQTILPRLLDAHAEHNITLLSALAPGADLIATRTMQEELATRRVQHRLLVIEAVPVKAVVEQFELLWRNGAVGDLDLSADALTWPQVRSALTASIGSVSPEWVVELDSVEPGAAQEACEAGYRRQNAYIVQRAHVVIAIIKPPLSDKPGGTGEAIAWRRDRSTMTGTMPRYKHRPNRMAPGFPGMIIVDTAERKITDEFAGA